MSLEEALNRNTETLERLIVALQSGQAAVAQLGEPEKKPTRGKAKDAPAATPAPSGETVYWLIEKHNTVYEQAPGAPAPSVEGAVQVSKEVYDAKKAEFAALTNTVLAKSTSAATQASAAPTAPTAEAAAATDAQGKTDAASSPTAGSAAPAPQASTAATFEDVMNKMKALNTSTAAGHGREGVLKILKQFLPDDAQPTVTKLQPLGKNAEVIAAVDALLTPAPAAEFDPLA